MIAPRPLQLVLWIGFVASMVGFFVLPVDTRWLAIVGAVVFAVANIGSQLLGFRAERRAVDAVLLAHPGETAIGTGLVAFDGVSPADRRRVRAVIADRNGLSFRDSADAEVVQVPASGILSLELAPHRPRSLVRPAVVARADGPPVEFLVGGTADDQAQNVMAIRSALGRA